MSDYWVVGKKSDRRELYVILNQKNANLIEVNGKQDLMFQENFNAADMEKLFFHCIKPG